MNELILFKDDKPNAGLIEIINQSLPEITRATNLFQKSQSHTMDNMLTVSHVTPIRNLRQILAEIKKIRLALGEAHFSIQKNLVEIEEKQEEKLSASPLKQKRLEIEIDEIEYRNSCIKENMTGAIRKLANYSVQYSSIQNRFNLQNFTEQDFELEEEKYHIIKAFEQGLNAARSRGGTIDEGNQIYFSQIGINGTVAQREVIKFLEQECAVLQSGNEPTHEMQLTFLLSMADKFRGCINTYADWKGMQNVG